MADLQDAEAVLITGVFGVGKTSVVEEMAELLEERSIAYGALDLDWLTWFDSGSEDEDRESEHRMMLLNLSAVVTHYLAAGARFFLLARSLRDHSDLDSLRASLPMPLRVVNLVLPLEEIEQRLSSAVTQGRQTDLRNAAAWLEASHGQGIGDRTVSNERAIGEVAGEILAWLDWK
jgi:hypothetical protein